MADEKRDDVTEEENKNNKDNREEETKAEIRDEDYREDDMIEMLRGMKDELQKLHEENVGIKEAIAAFIDNGAIIRETDDASDIDDFADDFIDIENMDLSVK